METGTEDKFVYEYDFAEYDRPPLDRKSAAPREFPRRRARFRRQADEYSSRGDYQYPDESMTSSTTSRAPPSERRANNGSKVSSKRQMSLPTDPEVQLKNKLVVSVLAVIMVNLVHPRCTFLAPLRSEGATLEYSFQLIARFVRAISWKRCTTVDAWGSAL